MYLLKYKAGTVWEDNVCIPITDANFKSRQLWNPNKKGGKIQTYYFI
jgi:hypothetical protein